MPTDQALSVANLLLDGGLENVMVRTYHLWPLCSDVFTFTASTSAARHRWQGYLVLKVCINTGILLVPPKQV